MHEDPSQFGDVAGILHAIRAMIENHQLLSDGLLPTERELAAGLGSGRRTLRRALDILEGEGLIWRRQGKGSFVGQPPDPTEERVSRIAPEVDPLVTMEVRLCIEPSLASLCARRATAEDVARLRQIAERVAFMAPYDGQHRRIIDAVETRDEDGAAAAMRELLISLADNLRRSLKEDGG